MHSWTLKVKFVVGEAALRNPNGLKEGRRGAVGEGRNVDCNDPKG